MESNHKWPLCLASFTQHNMFKDYLHCSRCQSFILFSVPEWYSFYKHASACLSIFPLMDTWVFSTPPEVWGPGAPRARILQIMGQLTLCRLYPYLCLKPLFSVGRLGDLLWLLTWLQMQVLGAQLSCRAVDTRERVRSGEFRAWGPGTVEMRTLFRLRAAPLHPAGRTGARAITSPPLC